MENTKGAAGGGAGARRRPAGGERGRLLGAGAHGRPGCARRGRDRRAARDQRRLSAGADLTAFGSPFLPFFNGSAGLSGVASSTASSIADESATTRAALVPKSCRP